MDASREVDCFGEKRKGETLLSRWVYKSLNIIYFVPGAYEKLLERENTLYK